ncbi:cytochrome-c oxidase, cbb3-type subunit III [uncultured Albimonas sp.]|uniref:cytochrome-c oxidase, cbb3-type subunit III n=1 Tax=uncultured Albimonas sp. TaxID=1331701 RepID=UPI0030ED5515|tara:strand:+ start:6386 stop:7276 length:891 start_codon:yes stop_codon:yes gene_type:complete
MADHDNKDVDELSGIPTTGHEWDGIKELDNPMPRWWLYTFYATVVWALLYTIAFPAWPLISSATGGVLGYSSRQNVMQDISEARDAQSIYVDKIAAMDVEAIADDPELLQFATAGGSALFKTWCAQCHGSGAAGAVGYPNLNDDDWLWGGTREAIVHTVSHGIRWEADPDTRWSQMPAFGRDGLLEDAEIDQVVEHVYGLSHSDADAELAGPGEQVFLDNCASCHGDDGRGMQDQGAPNLTDAIWLYGGDRAAISETVHNARFGVMPNWLGRLTEADVKQVAIYVHGLGGGETAED